MDTGKGSEEAPMMRQTLMDSFRSLKYPQTGLVVVVSVLNVKRRHRKLGGKIILLHRDNRFRPIFLPHRARHLRFQIDRQEAVKSTRSR